MVLNKLIFGGIQHVAEPNSKAQNAEFFTPAQPPASNDPEEFPAKKELGQFEQLLKSTDEKFAQASARSQAALDRVARNVRLVSAPAEPSRSSAAAATLNAQAETPPTESEHLQKFEETNKELLEAQQQFSEKWGTVQEYAAAHQEDFNPEAFKAAVESTGRTMDEYTTDFNRIQGLAQQSTDHLQRLNQHVVAYGTKHGQDAKEAIDETLDRVEASQEQLGYGGAVPKPGNGKDLIDDIKDKVKEMVEAVIRMLKNLFGGKEAKPA